MLRCLALIAAFGVLQAVACSSQALNGGDKGVDGALLADAAACSCQIVDGVQRGPVLARVLTMSWACYCQKYDCTRPPSCSPAGQWTRGCGLDEDTEQGSSGPESWVYDQSGQLVGVDLATDSDQWSCPSDPSMSASAVRAGQFPDTCNTAVTSSCPADGGAISP